VSFEDASIRDSQIYFGLVPDLSEGTRSSDISPAGASKSSASAMARCSAFSGESFHLRATLASSMRHSASSVTVDRFFVMLNS